MTFLIKNFLCFNFSNTDFLILAIINSLIKETNISQQQCAAQLFGVCCKYLQSSSNIKIKSFYQIEKGENNFASENNNNNSNITNQSIKMSHLNSANTSTHNFFNSPPKGGLTNNDSVNVNNNNNNKKNLKHTDSKLPYFLSLILNILNSFMQNPSSEKNANTNFNKKNKSMNNYNNHKEKSHIINSLKSSLGANFHVNSNNNNLIESNKFNPMEGEVFESFYNLMEKTFFFMQEILSNEKQIIGKLHKANAPEFAENDFNDKLFKIFAKAEITALNDIINFILKILFFKKTEKTLKNRIIYFYFESFEKILNANNNNYKNNNTIKEGSNNINGFNEENFSKNLFFQDENLLISILVLSVESLSEQFNSKAEEFYSELHNVLRLFKAFFICLVRNKDNLLKISQMAKVLFFVEKGNKLVLGLEEKLKQKRLVDDITNKIIQEEKNKNS